MAEERTIVSAKIHPAIGVARIGDSADGFFIGPEVTDPAPQAPGFYRDASAALKRQAARFRIFGYDANGVVVKELTADTADIRWTVHVANRKASWYRFLVALDIPEAAGVSAPRRNAAIVGAARAALDIDPGPRSIAGRSIAGGAAHAFDTGKFKTTTVPLGEIRTDDAGRLLVLGGRGASASPSNAPIFDRADGDTFNNADDWYDDTSDGPVTAEVTLDGPAIPVAGAWVVVAPPNYAPDVIGWRTLYDLLAEVQVGAMPVSATTSFARDVLPILRRLSNLQWVNQGFAAMFGKGRPMDFGDDAFIAKLVRKPAAPGNDLYRELRQLIFNAFRPDDIKMDEPRLWPWIYGDAFGSAPPDAPRNSLALPPLRAMHLKRWVDGDFVADWNPAAAPPRTIDAVDPADRPAMLDRAALHFCLADAFHPGCEVTWPMRHASLYKAPFRIRHAAAGEVAPDLGDRLTPQLALGPDGPLFAQGPGGLTRWMALPWQGDTAFCRSGYAPDYDPYLPTFWPARVPNQVLTEDNYRIVVDAGRPRAERLAAFNDRKHWTRGLPGDTARAMEKMVATFGAMGLVEARPGVHGDAEFPEIMLVESIPESQRLALQAAAQVAGPPEAESPLRRAGWLSQQQLDEARGLVERPR